MSTRPPAKSLGLLPQLTETKDHHVYTHDDRAHGSREELANTTKHHDHRHGDVDKPAMHESAIGSDITMPNQAGNDYVESINGATYKMLEKSILGVCV